MSENSAAPLGERTPPAGAAKEDETGGESLEGATKVPGKETEDDTALEAGECPLCDFPNCPSNTSPTLLPGNAVFFLFHKMPLLAFFFVLCASERISL